MGVAQDMSDFSNFLNMATPTFGRQTKLTDYEYTFSVSAANALSDRKPG